ncbi:MAG: ribbon-helix-helix domain-containing protein [Candidatus Diapherotrites archaeon]
MDKVTIAIPKRMYDEIAAEIKGTGFSSPSEWIKYILRQALSSAKGGKGGIISIPYLGSVKKGKGK